MKPGSRRSSLALGVSERDVGTTSLAIERPRALCYSPARMSYDLTISGAPDTCTPERVSTHADIAPFEVYGEAGRVTVSFRSSDEDKGVSEAFVALVEIALADKCTIHDPQVGANIDLTKPGSRPPGW